MPDNVPNILVIQPLPGIGDLFWFDEAVQSLSSFYHAPVTLLTKRQSQAQALYKDKSLIKEILWLDRPGAHDGLLGVLRLAHFLRRRKFSAVWIFHKSWRYKWACKLAGIPLIRGYGPNLKSQKNHPIHQASILLQQHGVPLLRDHKFPVSMAAKKKIQDELSGYTKPWIALGIGGSEPTKKWPSTQWEDLAVWLSNSKKVSVFLLGGAKEAAEAQAMMSGIHQKGGKAQALTHFSLQESLAFLDQVDLFVGNDTGMMNGAAVLNKRTIGLFLCTPPLTYRPSLKALQSMPGEKNISLAQVQEAVDQSLIVKPLKA